MNVRKTITTLALALGVLAGSAGIASAVSSTAQPAPTEDQARRRRLFEEETSRLRSPQKPARSPTR